MPQLDHIERCYAKVATPSGVALHFCDQEAIVPLGLRQANTTNDLNENVAYTLLLDYGLRYGEKVERLTSAFVAQFLADAGPAVIVTEQQIGEWLQVMKMLESH